MNGSNNEFRTKKAVRTGPQRHNLNCLKMVTEYVTRVLNDDDDEVIQKLNHLIALDKSIIKSLLIYSALILQRKIKTK